MWSRWRLSPQSPPDPSERSSVSFQPVTCRAAFFNLHDDPIADRRAMLNGLDALITPRTSANSGIADDANTSVVGHKRT